MVRLADNMDNFASIVNGDESTYAVGHTFRRERELPYYTLSFILTGRISLQSTAGLVEFPEHTLLLVPPRNDYVVTVLDPYRELWFVFDPRTEWRPFLDWGPARRVPGLCSSMPVTTPGHQEKIARGMRDVLEYRRSHFRARQRLAELALEQVLVLAASLSEHGGALDERLQRVLDALHHDLAHPWREAELAEVAGLSTSRFAHLFRQELGVPPVRYLERLRLEQAKALLLTTSLPIKTIADEVGYPDPLHFSGCFRRVVGHSPREFRRTAWPERAPGRV